ncbi:DsbA family protein [Paenibacillus sp. GCM10012306]|uniref:DsbA family oxidoreductase n=1 Tax=Paenibacillus sp. GCM10012306 TaxID=3317342 RepID=UPI0036172638
MIAKAYFEDGLDIGNINVLLQIAGDAGLDQVDIKRRLLNKEGVSEINEDVRFAQKAGIRSIPYFIINDRYAIQSPQSADTFLQAFQQIQTQEVKKQD